VATLKPGQSLVSDLPELVVDAGLPVGTYRFRLVVEDETRNQSEPVEVDVVVFQPTVAAPLTTVVAGRTVPVATPIVTPFIPIF
jgi:hypothetical protein